MKTITVQIGNSDDKLSQLEWSSFVREVDDLINEAASEVHFFGGAPNWYPWQNTCWIFVCDDRNAQHIQSELIRTRSRWRQESIAWTEGCTVFI
jgi:hypothetical protein